MNLRHEPYRAENISKADLLIVEEADLQVAVGGNP